MNSQIKAFFNNPHLLGKEEVLTSLSREAELLDTEDIKDMLRMLQNGAKMGTAVLVLVEKRLILENELKRRETICCDGDDDDYEGEFWTANGGVVEFITAKLSHMESGPIKYEEWGSLSHFTDKRKKESCVVYAKVDADGSWATSIDCVGCGDRVCGFDEEPPHKDDRDEAVCDDCWDGVRCSVMCPLRQEVSPAGAECNCVPVKN